MNMKTLLTTALSGAILVGAAHAEPVGSVSNIEGEVFALRGAETITLSNGDAVNAEDRIIARDGSSAVVDAYGCAASLSSGAMVTVSDSFCEASPVSFGYAQTGAEITPLLITAAMIAVPVAIGIAVSDDDDETENPVPVSP